MTPLEQPSLPRACFLSENPRGREAGKSLVTGLVLGVGGPNKSVLCNFLARAELASPQNRTVLMGRAGAM